MRVGLSKEMSIKWTLSAHGDTTGFFFIVCRYPLFLFVLLWEITPSNGQSSKSLSRTSTSIFWRPVCLLTRLSLEMGTPVTNRSDNPLDSTEQTRPMKRIPTLTTPIKKNNPKYSINQWKCNGRRSWDRTSILPSIGRQLNRGWAIFSLRVRTRAKGWCKVEKGSSEFASLHEMPLERNRHLAINYSKIRQTWYHI